MNNQYPHGMLTSGASRLKRKEREPFYSGKRSQPAAAMRVPGATVTASTAMTTWKGSKGAEHMSSKEVLAGYMAYEFLSKGTLLGQKLDATEMEKGNESYSEITGLLMMKSEGGVHIPGIVNPTQLARWIQM